LKDKLPEPKLQKEALTKKDLPSKEAKIV